MNFFAIVFASLLLTTLFVETWLAFRHIAYVRAHRENVPKAFSEAISLGEHHKAADYTIAKTRLGIIASLYSALLLLLWTLGGGLDLMDHLWRSANWGQLATGTAFMISVFLFMGVLDLPLQIYHTFVLEERFGFNKITPRTFVGDLCKQTLLAGIIGIPLVLLILWLMQTMGSLWWVTVWLAWMAFSLIMLWAYPTLIAPLFNKFEPLEKNGLYDRVQSLLERTGFQSKGIFVMDGSRRSGHGNAYFTGFGRQKRIVFFDTLLQALDEKEIEAVLAHELGHFKLKHVLKRVLVLFGMGLAGLALLGWLIQQNWFYAGLGISEPSTYTALMLFMLAGPVFLFFLQPFMAWNSRKHEFEADAFAAKEVEAGALIQALVKLYQENAATLTPDPLHSIFYDSHPPAPVRVAHLESKRELSSRNRGFTTGDGP